MMLPTLYARAVNNKVSTWYIEIEGNKFRTVSGYFDGEKVTSAWTECFAKNVGKSNNTTNDSQTLAQATSLWEKRMALGYFTDIKDIDNETFFEPMLAKDWEKEKTKVKYPVFSQPKLDGMRCITKRDGMWSRNGKRVISAPHIFESLKPLFEQYPDLVLDGELYADRNTTDFNTIISCVRKSKPEPEDLKISRQFIEYHIYDCGSHIGHFEQRSNYLIMNLRLYEYEYIKLVATSILNNITQINEKYKRYIELGYEGQMIRIPGSLYENKRTKNLLKHKSFVEDEFTIKGVVEGKGNLQGKVGKLNFEINGKPFDSAVNGGWEYLEELFKKQNLIGKKATVKYFELTEDGVPRFPKVVEIRDYE